MRSQCRSNGRSVTRRNRIARNELSRFAVLAVSVAAANGCTRVSVEELPKRDVTQDEAVNPITWSAGSRKVAYVDPTTTQDPGPSAVPSTPVNPAPSTDVPKPQVDAGPSAPIVVEHPPVVVDEPPPVVVPKATLSFNQSAAYSASPPTGEFSVQSVRELFIHTVWSDLKGDHTETRKFYSPSGELYYEKLTAFSTNIEAPVPFERPVSIPHSASVQATPLDANGNVIVSDYLSIAGTWISDRAMTGIWTVEVYLDDATKPSVTSDLELVP